MTQPNPPLADFSTQAAREAEQARRKLRRELLADWQRTRAAISADHLSAVRGISDAEWQKAQAQDAEGGEDAA